MKVLYWVMVPFIILSAVVYLIVFGIAFKVADKVGS